MGTSSIHSFVLILFLFSAMAHAQLEKMIMQDFWSNFKGTLGEEYLHLSLFPDTANDSITGSFCYDGKEQLYAVKGKFVDEYSMMLQVMDSTLPKHAFNLHFEDNEGHYFLAGSFQDVQKGETKKVNLAYASSSFGTAKKRYPDFGQNTQGVEAFMSQIKKAILQDDRDFIVRHVRYPASIKIDNKNLTIPDMDHFMAQYEAIITPALKDEIKKYHAHHLFSNHSGAMLGNGCIWINGYNSKTLKLEDIKITSLHLSDSNGQGPH